MRKVVEIPVQIAISSFGLVAQLSLMVVHRATGDFSFFPWSLERWPWSLECQSLEWSLWFWEWLLRPLLELWVLTQVLMLIHDAVNACFNDERIQRARALFELSEIRKSAWQRMPLLYLLELSQDHPRKATDPRDSLFALLGISQEAHDPAFDPRYKY
jgi:hypothetical protein